MPEARSTLTNRLKAILLLIAVIWVAYFALNNIGTFGNILLVALGFGAVIIVHEFGHFIVAKLSDIEVEAFSIGFPPVLLAIRKTEEGMHFCLLPRPVEDEQDESNKKKRVGLLDFTLGKAGKAGETEYRIGLLPFGGFVKMLGQDDAGPAEKTDDPRSFSNKSISKRIAVVTAGVVFNAISALIVFIIVFLVGIELTPPVVGGVLPDSPAAVAGLQPGDRIIQINKNTNLDFSNIPIAAALSSKDEAINLRVRHEDGSIKDISITPKPSLGNGLRLFGITRPATLNIEKVSDAEAMFAATGLKPGDKIYAADGKNIENSWQLEEIVLDHIKPTISLSVNRPEPGIGRSISLHANVPLSVTPTNYNFQSEYELSHICSMVPRLRIADVEQPGPPSGLEKFLAMLKVSGYRSRQVSVPLEPGDIITAVGDVQFPNFEELREVTTEHENKKLPVSVLRPDEAGGLQPLTVEVVPRRSPGSDRVKIGIMTVLDVEHPVVATTVTTEGSPEPLQIPRGASITRADGAKISNFYDLVEVIRANPGRQIKIEWRQDEQNATGSVKLDIPAENNYITVQSTFTDLIPFRELKELYKATGPIQAIQMGFDKTLMFIAQAYTTIKGLIGRLVSPKTLVGPLGIFKLTYTIVSEQPISYYFYFLGLISATIAVMNFLPLPILDGGVVVLLLVEKLKGSPISERTQAVLTYAGLAFIVGLALYVTRNDIINFFLN
jgi:regulator of sigma E protease